MPIRKNETQVAWGGTSERRPGDTAINPFGCGPSSIEKITQPLNNHVVAKEIGESSNIFPIANGIVEGLREIA
jgi:hypothetical protein